MDQKVNDIIKESNQLIREMKIKTTVELRAFIKDKYPEKWETSADLRRFVNEM